MLGRVIRVTSHYIDHTLLADVALRMSVQQLAFHTTAFVRFGDQGDFAGAGGGDADDFGIPTGLHQDAMQRAHEVYVQNEERLINYTYGFLLLRPIDEISAERIAYILDKGFHNFPYSCKHLKEFHEAGLPIKDAVMRAVCGDDESSAPSSSNEAEIAGDTPLDYCGGSERS